MKVLVLGGDGFCGWPTTLHLSDKGHDVIVVDNLSRREIDLELEVESLTPIRPMGERIRTWKELTGKDIGFVNLDLAEDYERFLELLRNERPDAIVHFGEQRAAPYSMRNAWSMAPRVAHRSARSRRGVHCATVRENARNLRRGRG